MQGKTSSITKNTGTEWPVGIRPTHDKNYTYIESFLTGLTDVPAIVVQDSGTAQLHEINITCPGLGGQCGRGIVIYGTAQTQILEFGFSETDLYITTSGCTRYCGFVSVNDKTFVTTYELACQNAGSGLYRSINKWSSCLL